MTENYQWEEYRLLQEKIDKIGEFRFRVKSWTITLILGYIVAAFAYRIPFYAFLPALLLVGAFHLFETSQARWSREFIRRASSLEANLRRTHAAPGIVNVIARHRRHSRRYSWDWVLLYAHGIFYLAMYSVVVIVAIGLANLAGEQPAVKIEFDQPIEVSTSDHVSPAVSPGSISAEGDQQGPENDSSSKSSPSNTPVGIEDREATPPHTDQNEVDGGRQE